jgi:hypothetical protein
VGKKALCRKDKITRPCGRMLLKRDCHLIPRTNAFETVLSWRGKRPVSWHEPETRMIRYKWYYQIGPEMFHTGMKRIKIMSKLEMISSLVEAITRNGGLLNPRSYKIGFIPRGSLMGDIVGEGWYIIAMSGPTVGPIASQEEAEDLLIAVLEEFHSQPFSEDEKTVMRACWKMS